MPVELNEISKNSSGGTELMCHRLIESMPEDLISEFQIIPSRVRELEEDKIRILWAHDLPNDPESEHLANEGWKKFHRIVFVSYFQRDAYIEKYKIPYSRVHVIKNAIEVFGESKPRETDEIRCIYHTTPHRGLEILAPVFERLAEKHKNIHLDVYSSFEIYGWKVRDEPYQPLFDKIVESEYMTYHGFKSQKVVRKALEKAHIFAYPSIWTETSCLSLMEAMSAGVCCVHPDFGALPETAAGWTMMYGYNENPNLHASAFFHMLDIVINLIKEGDAATLTKLQGQKSYADVFYNWEIRRQQWEVFLKSLLMLPREMEQNTAPIFEYKVG